MDAIDITIKHKPSGWKEITTGPEMSIWIRHKHESQWIEAFPGIYWISPQLYTVWQLEWI